MAIDKKDVTIISDRGTAITAAIKEDFKKAHIRYCPKHIERNLIKDGYRKTSCYISLYWKATNAKTETDFLQVMNDILIKPRGLS
jgi:hypothetical protein